MGCDIHTITEKKTKDGWQRARPDPDVFSSRTYNWFAFLGGVQNEFCAPSPFEMRGWPSDHSGDADALRENHEYDGHSATFVTLKELLDYDYEQTFENRKNTGPDPFKKGMPFGEYFALRYSPVEVGMGKKETIREFLGEAFFENIEVLQEIGEPDCVRVLMLFDN